MRPIAWLGLMLAAPALALFGVAAAGPLEDGHAAYQKGDYSFAQGELGFMYELGEGGVPQDYVLAHMWLNLAA